jgi:type III secretion protein V
VRRLLALAARLRGTGDVLLALAVLAGASLLVAPVPAWLVDAGLALSLGLSASLLVTALLAREPLRLSALPALLLLSTLLRLALSVASTRLVLSRGQAGRVIQALGEVAMHGSALAGAVVFAVLTLVQLLVVAKGAERVAEVAARFALDALPGKQMSIDADLRHGALDAAEARRRRRAVEREGQLHGAMDGALKFVKGDALAGVAIVLVNLVGGLASCLARGLSPEAALHRAAALAIGDGLASQIPGLLAAVAAGVAVTRVAGEDEGAGLAAEVVRQLGSDPRALWAASGLCALLALLPGMPATPFLVLAVAAGGATRLGVRPRESPAPPAEGPGPLLPPPPLTLELSPDLLALARAEGRFLEEAEPLLREALWREMGVRLPVLAVREAALPPGRWRLLAEEVPFAGGRADVDLALALAPPEDLLLAGIEGTPAAHPLTGVRGALVPLGDAGRAEALGPALAPLDRLLAGTAAALCAGAHHLVGVEEAAALLESLEACAPALAREAARQLPPALVAEVLRRLLEEGVPVRALRGAVEAMLEAGATARPAPALAEACRRALGRHLVHRLAPDAPLEAILLDPAAEAEIRAALAAGAPPLDGERAQALLARLGEALESAEGSPVLLTGPEVRRPVRDLVACRYPRLPVLAYGELPADWPVRPAARLTLAA